MKITEKEYKEALLVVQLYELQNEIKNVGEIKNIPPPPEPPKCRFLKEGSEPPKPRSHN